MDLTIFSRILLHHEQIFYSNGTVIEGISKSGRNFFKFNTNLTEPVLGDLRFKALTCSIILTSKL